MRVTGGATSEKGAAETLSGKAPAAQARWFHRGGLLPPYGNQIGLATGHVELYHEGCRQAP